MQILLYVKTQEGFELYCETCDSLYSQELVNSNKQYFMDIHRQIHKQMGLDTPDLPENTQSYPQNPIKLSTEIA